MAKGMENMLKQAQKLQSKILKVQEELGDKTVEKVVGGGMVKAVANGRQRLVSMKIDPEVVNPDDVQMLEDLIVAAVSEARRKALDLTKERMSALTGGIQIPGMF